MKLKALLGLLLISVVIAGSLDWKSDLIFSHKFHAQEVEAECSACHEAALTSESGKDDLLPEMQTCYNCHDEDMECAGCHEQPDEPVILPRVENYIASFSHKQHIDNDIECSKCHQGVSGKETVTSGMHLPKMDDCMKCHETPETVDGCCVCHDKSEQLKPIDHTEAWKQQHGMFSETGAQNCNSCHTENYCTECHQGENLFNNSHPAEFIASHGMSYMVRELDCASCHGSKDYCIECHMEVNRVAPINHSQGIWPASGHAEAARADFDNCTVCHTEADILCSQCHN